MAADKIHLRHCILYEYRKGNSAAVAARNIGAVYGKDNLDVRTCQRWFQKFRTGNLSLIDEPRSGRPARVDDNRLREIIEAEPRQSTREIAEKMGVYQSNVVRHIHQMGMTSKYNVWVPQELSSKDLYERISFCVSLLVRQIKDPFLDRLITGDERWVLYNNYQKKRQRSNSDDESSATSKRDSLPKRLLLCLWWDVRGVVHYELLDRSQATNIDRYCQQIDRLSKSVAEKRPYLEKDKSIIYHQSAKPHVKMATQHKLTELGWEVLAHPPHSPDLSPSDYYLFRYLLTHLSGKNLTNAEELDSAIGAFFGSKPEGFYSQGIRKLTERLQSVISSNGAYVVD